MNAKHIINFIILNFLLIASTILISQVFAQDSTETANIRYPVEELGNCKNETACRSYCDKPQNKEICFDFAEKNNLMSQEEIDVAKNFIEAGSKGPSGCAGKEECDAYCNDPNHIDECITFAVENDLMPPEKLEEAKKVQAAIKRGIKPPPCGGKEQCDIYCDEPDHMEECITFGIEAGFIQGKELEDTQKMLTAIKRGVKPPSCRGRDACDQYCGDPEHMEECMTFAMEAGFMNEQEKSDSQKMLGALKKGVKPPNCRGKEECDVYCGQEEHFEECTAFGEAAGFMTPEEAVMARKTKGKGPGGCKSREECDAFCNNPDNQQTCFDFGKENGLIPEEDLKMMEEGKQKFQESLNQAPSEVMDCLNSTLGNDMMEKVKSGSIMPPREIGEKMRVCFEKMGPPPGSEAPSEGGMISPAGQTGPGGCKTPDECKSYCETNPADCKNFGPEPGKEGAIPVGPPPRENQPGIDGCKTPEECQKIMPPPPTCEGENCKYGPPPSQPGQPGQQPPTEWQRPPEGQQPPQLPNIQNPSEFQQPPTNQLSPAEQQQPIPQSPPAEQQPPPSENPPPPPAPSSFLINPNSLLGSVVNFFVQIFGR